MRKGVEMKRIKPASVLEPRTAPQGKLTEESAKRVRIMAKRLVKAGG